MIGVKNWEWYSVRSCRKGACSAATMAKMPEHFTDTLGNWRSRAKETYRRTTLAKAQTEFCTFLGGNPERGKAKSPMTRMKHTRKMRTALHKIHGKMAPNGSAWKCKKLSVGYIGPGPNDPPGVTIRAGGVEE